MKKIKPIALKDTTLLCNEEMKNIFGGSATKMCKCTIKLRRPDGSIYYQPVPIIMANPNKDICISECSGVCNEYNEDPSGALPCAGYEATFD